MEVVQYIRKEWNKDMKNGFAEFVAKVKELLGKRVAMGSFGADMQIELTNDGPVTIWIDSKNRE